MNASKRRRCAVCNTIYTVRPWSRNGECPACMDRNEVSKDAVRAILDKLKGE